MPIRTITGHCVAVIATGFLAISIAACSADGGGSTSTTASASTAASGSGQTSDPAAALRACLEKQGVTMPSDTPKPSAGDLPDGPPTGVPAARPAPPALSDTQQQVFEACASLAPKPPN